MTLTPNYIMIDTYYIKHLVVLDNALYQLLVKFIVKGSQQNMNLNAIKWNCMNLISLVSLIKF